MSAIVFEKVTKNFEKNTALLATDLKINEKNLQFFWDQAVVVKLLF